MIKKLYQERSGLTVLVLAMHPHSMMMGPRSAEDNVRSNMTHLEKVLNYLEGLQGMQYANYLDVHKHYCQSERTPEGKIKILDVGNGFLICDGKNSAKYQSVGVGEPFLYDDPVFDKTSLAVGQDNGIAEWLVNGESLIGPRIPGKSVNKTYRRKALVTTEVRLGNKDLKVPQKNMKPTLVKNEGNVGFQATCRTGDLEIRSRYIFNKGMDTLMVETVMGGKQKSKAVACHHYELHPSFGIETKGPASIVLAREGLKICIQSPDGFRKIKKTENGFTVKANIRAARRTTKLTVVAQ